MYARALSNQSLGQIAHVTLAPVTEQVPTQCPPLPTSDATIYLFLVAYTEEGGKGGLGCGTLFQNWPLMNIVTMDSDDQISYPF